MKNTVSEMRNVLDGLKSRQNETEESTNEIKQTIRGEKKYQRPTINI